jgi:hypothetical protein
MVKVRVYKEDYRSRSLSMFSIVDQEWPLEEQISRGIGSIQKQSIPACPSLLGEQAKKITRRPLTVEIGGEAGSWSGSCDLIVMDNLEAGLEDMRHLKVSGDSFIDNVISSLQAGRSVHRKLLNEMEEDRPRRHSKGRLTERLLKRLEFEDNYPIVMERNACQYYAPELRFMASPGFFTTLNIPFGDHVLARGGLAIVGSGRSYGFDGFQFKNSRDLLRLDEDLLGEIDKHGSCASLQIPTELFSLKARVFLKLPGRDEIPEQCWDDACKIEERAPKLLDRPAFAFHSEAPVYCTGQEAVIDDPALAMFVVSRISDGLFINSDTRPFQAFSNRTQWPKQATTFVLAELAL